MKRKFFYLFSFLVLALSSCDRDDSLLNYSDSSVTVKVPDCKVNTAIIAVFAKDVKALEIFTIGVCYSTSEEPTIQDPHVELEVNSDTLIIENMTLNFDLTGLTKGTDYYVKAYIKTAGNTFYSEQEKFTTPFNTLNIEVSDDYISDGQECWIVLSNNSTTLLTQKLENDNTYSFSENIPDLADIHIMKLSFSNNKYNLNVASYTDITPDDFFLDYQYTSTPNIGQVTVTVPDLANFLRWGVASTKWSIQTTNSSTKSLTNYLTKEPDNIFVHYLPADGSAPRYKYDANVTLSSSKTYMMADFVTMTNYSEIALPTNNYFYYYLAGYNDDYYSDYIRYYGHTYSSGYNGTFRLYYPTAIKSKVYFYASYSNSNQQSIYIKNGSLPTVYFTQFPDITINNSSNYTLATSGINNSAEYEVLNLVGIYSSTSVYVTWNYFKQPQTSNSVAVPEFPAEIIEKTGNLNASVLSLVNVGYFNILNSQVTTYKNYVDLLIKQSERFYDVVQEYRIYYQSASNKSDVNVNDNLMNDSQNIDHQIHKMN